MLRRPLRPLIARRTDGAVLRTGQARLFLRR
jgi:hypothetical protein